MINPPAAPTARAATAARVMLLCGDSLLVTAEATLLVRLTMGPIERSMPPVSTTRVCPRLAAASVRPELTIVRCSCGRNCGTTLM